MAKELGYTPISIFAACCSAVATKAAMANQITAPLAVSIGAVANAIAGGFELNDKELCMKEEIEKALHEAWLTIDKKYHLSYYSEECLLELQQEILGERTSVDEVIRNLKDKRIVSSLSIAIKNILEKHRGTLNRDTEISWDDATIDNAALDIAIILMKVIRSAFENVDHLLIMKSSVENTERITREVQESEKRLIEEIQNQNKGFATVPLALSTIPSAVDLVGRDNDINEIYNLLRNNNIVSIHTYGGVGKTAVAAKIINEIKHDVALEKSSFKHIAWITSTGNLVNDLTALNISSENKKRAQEEKYREISTFLQSHPTFLVIDNIDKPLSYKELDELNTISGKTKVLITARADIQNVEEYSLNELSLEDALLLFYWHYNRKKITIDEIRKRDDCTFSEKIVQAATYNALLIELIGKMAYAEHMKLEWLWEKLCKDIFDLDSKHPIYVAHGDGGTLLEHICKLYKMSCLTERQIEIMSFMALFPAEQSIFFDVFLWAEYEDDEVDNLGELQQRGWIERSEEGYLLHTMVKGSVEQQDKGDFDEDRYRNLIIKLCCTDEYLPSDMEFPKARERLIVTDTICCLLADKGNNRIVTATLFNNIAGVYIERGYYEKALDYLEKVIVIYEEVFGKANLLTANTFVNIAGVYKEKGNYEKALEYLKKALVIQEKEPEKEHQLMATTYNNIAGVYKDQGNNKKALEYYEKALVILEKVHGKEHPYTATAYNNIACVYELQRRYEKALEYYEKALVIREKVYGNEHPLTATTYVNIASVYQDQERYEKALEYYEKALIILEKVPGKEHPLTASTYNNLADLYLSQGYYIKALRYYKKALAIREKVLGEDHPDTAMIYNNMAGVHKTQGNYAKAMKYLKKTLEIQEKVLGENNPDTAMTYNNLASIFEAQGDYNEALKYYQKAVTILKMILGVDHLSTAGASYNLGVLFYNMEDYESAKKHFMASTTALEKLLGENHPNTKNARLWLSAIKEKLKNQ